MSIWPVNEVDTNKKTNRKNERQMDRSIETIGWDKKG
jgi:hypothetical protein